MKVLRAKILVVISGLIASFVSLMGLRFCLLRWKRLNMLPMNSFDQKDMGLVYDLCATFTSRLSFLYVHLYIFQYAYPEYKPRLRDKFAVGATTLFVATSWSNYYWKRVFEYLVIFCGLIVFYRPRLLAPPCSTPMFALSLTMLFSAMLVEVPSLTSFGMVLGGLSQLASAVFAAIIDRRPYSVEPDGGYIFHLMLGTVGLPAVSGEVFVLLLEALGSSKDAAEVWMIFLWQFFMLCLFFLYRVVVMRALGRHATSSIFIFFLILSADSFLQIVFLDANPLDFWFWCFVALEVSVILCRDGGLWEDIERFCKVYLPFLNKNAPLMCLECASGDFKDTLRVRGNKERKCNGRQDNTKEKANEIAVINIEIGREEGNPVRAESAPTVISSIYANNREDELAMLEQDDAAIEMLIQQVSQLATVSEIVSTASLLLAILTEYVLNAWGSSGMHAISIGFTQEDRLQSIICLLIVLLFQLSASVGASRIVRWKLTRRGRSRAFGHAKSLTDLENARDKVWNEHLLYLIGVTVTVTSMVMYSATVFIQTSIEGGAFYKADKKR